ncbi:MAG TPA: prepilin-type N-terminal cleavage/methylation domain-containing protein [Candidatus Acidoferrum sp.]|nr:prepilin-type N-terminal cleavage/methylation domain-containing protein [Candidatus Acidoferrum sp.]
MKRRVPIRRQRRAKQARGFSLVELLIATVILLVGLVGIAQLVPTSILINQKGRLDSTSLVFAQRELDQMVGHPLTDTSFFEANGALCASFCSLGDGSTPGFPQGNNVLWVNNRPFIDFGGAPVDNFSFTYTDPNDPFGVTYDVRWAVLTTLSGSSITGKRFFVGVRQLNNASTFIPAVTLDASVAQ